MKTPKSKVLLGVSIGSIGAALGIAWPAIKALICQILCQ